MASMVDTVEEKGDYELLLKAWISEMIEEKRWCGNF